MLRQVRLSLFAAALALIAGAVPAPSAAVELSDFKVDFTNVSAGTDPDAGGSLRLRAQGGEATLQIRLRGVDADPVQLCAFETEGGALVAQAELAAGGGTLTSEGELDFDPRTKYLTISTASDCSGGHLLEATLADPADCVPGSRTKLKIHERAELEPGTQAPEGASAELLYHVLPDRNCKFANDPAGPRRKARLSVRVKHASANDSYDVCIDDDDKGALSTNPAGVGRSDFTFNQPKGNGQGSSKRSLIDFDAYASRVEIRDDGVCDVEGDEATAVFFGSLLAPLCSEQELATASLTPPPTPPDPAALGDASLTRDEGCARRLVLSVSGFAVDGSHDVFADSTLLGSFEVGSVVSGEGSVVFSSDPDTGASELPLPIDPTGLTVEVRRGSSVVVSGPLDPVP